MIYAIDWEVINMRGGRCSNNGYELLVGVIYAIDGLVAYAINWIWSDAIERVVIDAIYRLQIGEAMRYME